MTKESLGYVELEWTCPNCGTRNPGRVKVCKSCGAPQPKDVQFEQAAEDKIVTDQEGLELAQTGPDIHCPFCGTRNPGNATVCMRCGGDLTEGEKRESGQVLGAQQKEPAPDITCPYCGTINPGTNTRCSNCNSPLARAPRPQPAAAPARTPTKVSPALMIAGVALILLICGGIFFLVQQGTRTETGTGRVSNVNWKRSIVIMAPAPVNRSAWADQIPSGAQVGSCTQRERGRSAFPTDNSQQVCGTPYVVDQGSGFGELVQDCEYIVYDDYCQYSVIELQPVGVLEKSGTDLSPIWPETRLQSGQELGQRDEVYEVTFVVDGKQYVYRTRDANDYARFRPNTEWELEINGFGDIVAIREAR